MSDIDPVFTGEGMPEPPSRRASAIEETRKGKRRMPDRFYDALEDECCTLTLRYTVRKQHRRVMVLNGETPLWATFREAHTQFAALVREGFQGSCLIERRTTIGAA